MREVQSTMFEMEFMDSVLESKSNRQFYCIPSMENPELNRGSDSPRVRVQAFKLCLGFTVITITVSTLSKCG